MSDIEVSAYAALQRRRDENRKLFPEISKIVNQFTEHFGLVHVKGGAEAGKSFGLQDDLPPDSDRVFSGDRLILESDFCIPPTKKGKQ